MFGKLLIIPQEPHPFIPSPHAVRGLLAQLKGGGLGVTADITTNYPNMISEELKFLIPNS